MARASELAGTGLFVDGRVPALPVGAALRATRTARRPERGFRAVRVTPLASLPEGEPSRLRKS